MILTCAVTALFIGAMVGLRFNVFVLVPAVVIGSVAILGIGMAHSNNLWLSLLAMVVAITALQIGYLVGAVIYVVIARTHFRKNSQEAIAAKQGSLAESKPNS
jgi:hydrogenase/urease accessory protein HupE